MKDPVECCLLAGVQAPASALQTGSSIELTLNSPQSSFEIRPTSLSDGASLDSIEGSDILVSYRYFFSSTQSGCQVISCRLRFTTNL